MARDLGGGVGAAEVAGGGAHCGEAVGVGEEGGEFVGEGGGAINFLNRCSRSVVSAGHRYSWIGVE